MEKEIRFISPIDGDMLNANDGITVTDGTLITQVKITAPAGSKIKVNGVTAKYTDGIFQADVSLKNYENIIEMVEGEHGYKESITVFRLKNCVNKYRFSFNANILVFKDIAKNADRYQSIFDNQYLGIMKQVHDTYGAKIHLNIFYRTDGFNLSQMPDKFKDEWKANATWLELSFSGLADEPDKPYIQAGYDEVLKDCALVKKEIRRFAGEEVMSHETTLHWGEATVEGCRALKDSGYDVLAGYFNVDDDKAPVSYYLNVDQRRNIKKRFIWRDNKENIIFVRLSLVVNTVKIEDIVPHLDNIKKTYNPGLIDLMIHEHYFQPDYFAYQPDYREKIFTAVKWAVDNGYTPGFLKECVFE
ncbi:MAG: hypothetical protein LBG96_11395 [Tannerella sp.]|nr:hypothetical protein [Tannerella sp.]